VLQRRLECKTVGMVSSPLLLFVTRAVDHLAGLITCRLACKFDSLDGLGCWSDGIEDCYRGACARRLTKSRSALLWPLLAMMKDANYLPMAKPEAIRFSKISSRCVLPLGDAEGNVLLRGC
jgi:hypothetical protein